MRKLVLCLLPLVISAAEPTPAAEPSPKEALLVLSKAEQTLSIVDPSSFKVIARMPSGPDPHEVSVSADGKMAWISNYGGGAYHTLTPVDLVAQKSLAPVDLGAMGGPHGLMFAAGKLWFTAEAAKLAGAYNPATNQVDWIMGTGQNRTHMIYVLDGGKRVVTSNISSATMTFIDRVERRPPQGAPPPQGNRPPTVDWEETVIPVGPGAEGFDATPDGKELWAANAGDGTISVIDVAGKKVVQTLDAKVPSANRLKITPDGKLAVVSGLRLTEVAVFDVATRKEVKRIKTVCHGAAGIQMQPDNSRIFVACTPDNLVLVIDRKSLEVTGRIDAGKNPDGMDWMKR